MNLSYLDSIFEPIALVDESGKLTYYNHYFSSFFKASPRVLKKIKGINELFSGFDILDLLSKSKESNSIQVSKEVLINLSDMSEYHVVFKIVPQDDQQYLICINDISIEKNLYTKYRYQIDELKSIHNQIIQADKLTTIGEITASISHEVSNPLTIASGTLELLKALTEEGDLDSQSEMINTCINDIDESFSRINSIIKGMKNFLHQNEEDHLEYIAIEDSLNSALNLLEGTIKQNNIKVTSPQSENSIVFANPTKLEQVFINLVKNSVDALSNQADSEIEIKLNQTNVCYEIDFIDNGIGINDESKAKIFESFYTTKDVGEGTGLGLAISTKIIESYQGSIELVDSNKGAHFKITIPKMELTSVSNTTLASGIDTDSNFLSILVVDNEPKILNLLNNYISELGHQLICASNILEAQKTIDNYDVDLIITDFFMPQGNGDELAKAIRDKQIETPIYYLSAKIEDSKLKQDMAKFNISGLIDKPFEKKDIEEVLCKVVGSKK